MRPIILLGAQALALFPAIHWYAVHTRYASGDRWELIALVAAALYFAARAHRGARPGNLVFPAVLTLAWAAGTFLLPPLLATWLAWTALAATISTLFLGRLLDPHLFGLVTLSLPSLPLFQYHLSYPLRAAVAECSAMLLRFGGFTVVREGTCLAFGQRLIWVDAPCSGLRMMWSALLLAICLAALNRLSIRRLSLLLATTLVTVVCANILRTTWLFFVEAEILAAPDWIHPGSGIAVFVMVVAVLFHTARTEKGTPCAATVPS